VIGEVGREGVCVQRKVGVYGKKDRGRVKSAEET